MKDNDLSDTHKENPFTVLLAQLTSHNTLRPRLQIACNVWCHEQKVSIEKETRIRADALKIPLNKLAPVREKVVKEMYDALNDSQRSSWERKAKAEHEVEMEKWKMQMKNPASTSPAERQR